MPTFKIIHTDGSYRSLSSTGETLPVRANDREHAVVMVFGAPADENSFTDDGHFTKWNGSYKGQVVEI